MDPIASCICLSFFLRCTFSKVQIDVFLAEHLDVTYKPLFRDFSGHANPKIEKSRWKTWGQRFWDKIFPLGKGVYTNIVHIP